MSIRLLATHIRLSLYGAALRSNYPLCIVEKNDNLKYLVCFLKNVYSSKVNI